MQKRDEDDLDLVTIRVPRAAAQQWEAQQRVTSSTAFYWPLMIFWLVGLCIMTCVGVVTFLIGVHNFFRDNPWSAEFMTGPPVTLISLFFLNFLLSHIREYRRIQKRDANDDGR